MCVGMASTSSPGFETLGIWRSTNQVLIVLPTPACSAALHAMQRLARRRITGDCLVRSKVTRVAVGRLITDVTKALQRESRVHVG